MDLTWINGLPRCFVTSTKNIQPNEILYIDYGRGYDKEAELFVYQKFLNKGKCEMLHNVVGTNNLSKNDDNFSIVSTLDYLR